MGLDLVFGSVMFFILMFIVGVILIVATELEEQQSWLFLVIPITIGLLYWNGNSQAIKDSIKYISENPWQITLYVLLYLFVGTIWSLIKWYMYLIEMRDHYKKYGSGSYYKDNYSLNENKERILNWMVYWPLSVFWILIKHPLRNMFKWIIKTFGAQYQKISDNVLKDLNEKKK